MSISYLAGYKSTGQLTISGPNAYEKAKKTAEIIWKRLNALGFNYEDLEDAMKNPNSPHRQEYEKIRKQNLHKMEPIPVCKIPS